jgi:hypothetical protein
MMIPTDVVTLKLHAAKSSAAFLSDFFRELMSDFMVSAEQCSLNYNLEETAAIRFRNPSFGLQKEKWSVNHDRAIETGNTARDYYTSTPKKLTIHGPKFGMCTNVKCDQSSSPSKHE